MCRDGVGSTGDWPPIHHCHHVFVIILWCFLDLSVFSGHKKYVWMTDRLILSSKSDSQTEDIEHLGHPDIWLRHSGDPRDWMNFRWWSAVEPLAKVVHKGKFEMGSTMYLSFLPRLFFDSSALSHVLPLQPFCCAGKLAKLLTVVFCWRKPHSHKCLTS